MSKVPEKTRHEFFVRRLKECGVYDVDSDYGGMIGKAIEELSLAFSKQGHSGVSAAITVELFDQLMREWQGRAIVPEAIEEVLNERKRQDEKWGTQDHGPFVWLPILVEEVGEAAKAVLEKNMPGYRKELTQVAAVAVAALEALARGVFVKDNIVALQTEVAALRRERDERKP